MQGIVPADSFSDTYGPLKILYGISSIFTKVDPKKSQVINCSSQPLQFY